MPRGTGTTALLCVFRTGPGIPFRTSLDNDTGRGIGARKNMGGGGK